jgi:phosphoglycolate phosphatase
MQEVKNAMKCNICQDDRWEDMRSRRRVRCKGCNSVERTRLLWMYLERAGITAETRVLHLAPEKGLHRKLREMLAPDNYVCADLDPARYPFADNIRQIDLCDLEGEASDQYDIILHSHVMEHIPCNIAYTLYHLHRMLTPDGLHICVIPFLPGQYDECFQDIGDEERHRRFGQHDHVRRFGEDDRERHLGSIVRLPEAFDASEEFDAERLLEANIPEKVWRGFTPNTVLQLRKGDYRLASW